MISLKNTCLALLFFFAQHCSGAGSFRKDWEIQYGKCRDCVDIDDDDPSAYLDFAIYKDQLYLCDYGANRIRVYDKKSKNIRNIPLNAQPEVLALFGHSLLVFVRDGSIAAFDLDRDSLSSKKSIGRISKADYSLSFIVDSLLTIPVTNGEVAEKIKALAVNIKNPESRDTIMLDYSRRMEMAADTSFKHRPSTLIDLIGGNEKYLVLKRFESDSADESSGFILLDRRQKTVKRMDPIPKEFGEIMHSWTGRGMKVIDDRIYFISEATRKTGNTLVVGSFPLP